MSSRRLRPPLVSLCTRLRERHGATRWALLVALWLAPLTPAAAPPAPTPPSGAPGDPAVAARFQEARRHFDSGALERAETLLRALVHGAPADPLVPIAQVYRARIALARGRAHAARDLLAPYAQAKDETPAASQARFFLGLAQARAGAHEEARRWLRPLAAHGDADQQAAALAALALSSIKLKDHAEAIGHLARLHAISSRQSERTWARELLEREIDDHLGEADVERLQRGAKAESLLFALATRRLAELRLARGQTAAADRWLKRGASARDAHGVHLRQSTTEFAGERSLGLLLPLSGAARSGARLVLAAATTAAGTFDTAPGSAPPLPLAVRNSLAAGTPGATALIDQERVLAIVAASGSDTARATKLAAQHGVPFLSLDETGASPLVLRMVPSEGQRVRRLIQLAAARHPGLKLAVLAPQTPRGQRLALQARTEVTELGGAATLELALPPGSANLAASAARIAASPAQALFVPDEVGSVVRIVAALAQRGIAVGDTARAGPRRTLILIATADGIEGRALGPAALRLEGAVVAPGYCPDDQALGRGTLLRHYALQHGRYPTLVEALAFDAVGVVRTHLERGVRGRAALRAALARSAAPGLTGRVRFDSTGERADPPQLCRVTAGRLAELPSAPPAPSP